MRRDIAALGLSAIVSSASVACGGTPQRTELAARPTPQPADPNQTALVDPDADRILNPTDACPVDPEVYNGFEDEDGCPDRGEVVVVGSTMEVLDHIAFARNSSSLSPQDGPVIEAVAATLRANPGINRFAVRGYAERDELDTESLSLVRAQTIANELVRLGVAMTRLQVTGMGTTHPLPRHGDIAPRMVDFSILEVNGEVVHREEERSPNRQPAPKP